MPLTLQEAIARTQGRSLVDPNRMQMLWNIAQTSAQRCAGAMLEVGVYRGGTAQLLREAVPDREFLCIDTFAGHPTPNPQRDHPNHWEGRFSETSLEEVEALFAGHDNPPRFIQAEFSANGPALDLEKLCFVHVDVDLHDGTQAAFARLWPLLEVGGAIVCDDYGFDDCPGAKTAVRAFVDHTPGARLEELHTLQCAVWKDAPTPRTDG